MATIAEELAKLTVLDKLARAENPILNVEAEPAKGTWLILEAGVRVGQVRNEAGEAKGWTPVSSFVEGADAAYYAKSQFATGSGFVAVSHRLTAQSVPASPNRYQGMWLHRDKTSPKTVKTGYFLRIEYISGTGATTKFTIKLEKWVAGVITVLKEVTPAEGTYTAPKESRFAIVAGGGKLYIFASKEKATAYEQLGEVTESTYTEGYVGLMGAGTGTTGIQDFSAGTWAGEEEPGLIKPNPASAEASIGEDVLSNHIVETGEVPSAAASMPNVELVGGAMPSGTEHEVKGLPLPFPSVLANPARLGPPRFTALERKTLGLKR